MPNLRLPRGHGGWTFVLRTSDLCPITPAWRRWGRVGVVRDLVQVAWRFHRTGKGRLALADVSRRGGGYLPPHASHRVGLDADIRPARRDGRQCIRGTTWRSRTYDRRGTRQLIRAIRAVARGRVHLIYFDDPVLIRAGLTRYWPGHDDHLHVRFCGASRSGIYACSRPRRGRHRHGDGKGGRRRMHQTRRHPEKQRSRREKHGAAKRHRSWLHGRRSRRGPYRRSHRATGRTRRFVPLRGAEHFGLDGYVPMGFGYPFFK
jgi:Penicillin-insensitive murein endopeptidase